MEDNEKQVKMPSLRKILSYVSIMFTFFSIFLLFGAGILGWLAIDNAEKTIKEASDNVCSAISSTALSLNDLGNGILDIRNSLNKSASSFNTFSSSLEKTSGSLSLIDKDLGSSTKSAADDLKNASLSFAAAANDLSKLEQDLSGAKTALINEKEIVCGKTIKDQFGNLRLIFIIGFLLVFFTLLAFGLNSAAILSES